MAVGALPFLSELQTEFGLPAGNSFFDLIRGGAYVPDIAANAAVGTTAAGVYLSQFPNTTAEDPNTVMNWANISGTGGSVSTTSEAMIADCTLTWTTSVILGSGFITATKNGGVLISGDTVQATDGIIFTASAFPGSSNGATSVFSDGNLIDIFAWTVS